MNDSGGVLNKLAKWKHTLYGITLSHGKVYKLASLGSDQETRTVVAAEVISGRVIFAD